MIEMKKVVNIPEGVTVEVNGMNVKVKGSNAELERDFTSSFYGDIIKIEKTDSVINVISTSDKRKIKSGVGAIASIIDNMIQGSLKDFKNNMKSVFMHFPMTVKVEGDKVVISNFLGERSIRSSNIIGKTKVDIKKDVITVTGPNKEEVGQTCANMEKATRITGRDRRIYQDGIFLVSK